MGLLHQQLSGCMHREPTLDEAAFHMARGVMGTGTMQEDAILYRAILTYLKQTSTRVQQPPMKGAANANLSVPALTPEQKAFNKMKELTDAGQIMHPTSQTLLAHLKPVKNCTRPDLPCKCEEGPRADLMKATCPFWR